jgi:hypothetical protein
VTVSGVHLNQPQPTPPNPEEWATADTGNFYTEQIASIRRLRRWATVVAVLALASLIGALGATVWSFTKQIDKATPAVNLKELVASAKAGKNHSGASQAPTPNTQSGSEAKNSSVLPAVQAAVAEPVVVTTAVSVDISSIGNSIVAVVSVLVVAIAVLAISLLRTTYTLSVERLREKPAATPVAVDTSLPIPGAELVKAIGEALATVLKGLPGKKD